MKNNVFLLYPCIDGKPNLKSINSIQNHAQHSKLCNVQIYYVTNESLISRLRSISFFDFLQTNCEYYCSIDSDIELLNCPINYNYFDQMINNNKDFTGGLYSIKVPGSFTPASVPFDCKSELAFNIGLIKMKWLSSGCWFIKRNVIEKLYEHYKDLMSDGETKHEGKVICNICNPYILKLESGFRKLLSEDWALCQRWLDIGGEIFADTTIILNHIGSYDNYLLFPLPEEPKKKEDDYSLFEANEMKIKILTEEDLKKYKV